MSLSRLQKLAQKSLESCYQTLEDLPRGFVSSEQQQQFQNHLKALEKALSSHSEAPVLENHLKEIDRIMCDWGQQIANHMQTLLPKVE